MLAIDLFCGLGGWTEGLLAEGFDVIGFGIEQHVYGEHRYPAQLVVQDVLTLDGAQFKSADLIVASPPCQEYSYMAMPWARARAKAAAIRADTTGAALERLNRLFDACFRLQREAQRAAGHAIPLIVENVRGAQPWVGRSRWSFGSFHLWGDVPALMPMTVRATKLDGFRFDGSGRSFQSASVAHVKLPGNDWNAWRDRGENSPHWTMQHFKNPGINLTNKGFNIASREKFEGQMGDASAYVRSERDKRQHIGASRKFASAMIAKIPIELSRWIARTMK